MTYRQSMTDSKSENATAVDSTKPTLLQLKGISKSFGIDGKKVEAIKSVNLSIRTGEFLSIIGPSGCGKSTLLQIMAGLEHADSGDILLHELPVTAPPADMVYLFQQYSKSLFPWLTIWQNVAFAFEHRVKLSAGEKRDRSLQYLKMVKLEQFADHYPRQLSGGMLQRAAIARALAAEPRILLMDEPFSAVDALTRIELHELILELWRTANLTIILVTHDVDEAVYLSDRVALLGHRPSTIVDLLTVSLERPRDPVKTSEETEFIELRSFLLNKLLMRPVPRR
jgi:NitT/TauT family transport system ATP-binding protein